MTFVLPPRLEATIRSRLGMAPGPQSSGGIDGKFGPAGERRVEVTVSCPPLLPEGEIVRALRYYRRDPGNGRGRGRKVQIKFIAEMAGLHRVTVYRAIWTGRISERSREALSPVLIMLQVGM
jgi:hypothetical protein